MNQKDYIKLLSESPLSRSDFDAMIKKNWYVPNLSKLNEYEESVLEWFRGDEKYYNTTHKRKDIDDYVANMVSKKTQKKVEKINTLKDAIMKDVKDELRWQEKSTKQYIQKELGQYKGINTRIDDIVQRIKVLGDKKDLVALQEYIQSIKSSLKSLVTKEDLDITKAILSSKIITKAEKWHTHIEFKDIIALKNEISKLKSSMQEIPDFTEVKKAFDNVYTKDETYSKQEVDTRIKSIKKWDVVMLSKWWNGWWGDTHDPVTLEGTPNYITIAWQVITRALINLASHVTGRLPFANFAEWSAHTVIGRAWSGTWDVDNITAWNDTILSRSWSWNVSFNSAATVKTILSLNNVNNTSDANKPISTATQTALDWKQATLVSGTNIKTINGQSVLGSGNLLPQHRVTIPWEIIADTSNYQWLYRYNNTGATVTISNIAFAVWSAAAWTGAACAFNVYKSSGTAVDWLNTNAVALFTTAVNLWTGYTSLTNVPNTATVENGRRITVRVTSSAGATNRASNAQVIISF